MERGWCFTYGIVLFSVLVCTVSCGAYVSEIHCYSVMELAAESLSIRETPLRKHSKCAGDDGNECWLRPAIMPTGIVADFMCGAFNIFDFVLLYYANWSCQTEGAHRHAGGLCMSSCLRSRSIGNQDVYCCCKITWCPQQLAICIQYVTHLAWFSKESIVQRTFLNEFLCQFTKNTSMQISNVCKELAISTNWHVSALYELLGRAME